MLSTNVFKEICVKITLLRSTPKKTVLVCNAVYLRLCTDLMHITPSVNAEGYDGSHHTRYAECGRIMANLLAYPPTIYRSVLGPILRNFSDCLNHPV